MGCSLFNFCSSCIFCLAFAITIAVSVELKTEELQVNLCWLFAPFAVKCITGDSKKVQSCVLFDSESVTVTRFGCWTQLNPNACGLPLYLGGHQILDFLFQILRFTTKILDC